MSNQTSTATLPRELAEEVVPRELAEDRVFSETEHTAILADRVAQETAAAQAEVATAQSELVAVTTERDALRAQVTQLEVEKAAAEQAKADLEAKITADAEMASRTAERVNQVREVAKTMPAEWFDVPARQEQWAAMEQATFDNLIETLSAVSGVAPAAPAAAEVASVGAGNPVTPKTKPDTRAVFAKF